MQSSNSSTPPAFFLIFALGFLEATATSAAPPPHSRIEDLEKRIADLEEARRDTLIESSDRSRSVGTFLNDRIYFGGFFESGLSYLTGPDTEPRVSAVSHTLGINLSADFSNSLRFVNQHLIALVLPLRNFNNDPSAVNVGQPATRDFGPITPAALLTQGYLQYDFSNHLNIQGGLGYVPFGYAFQQRELTLFLRRSGPQVLRTRNLVNPLWSGVHLNGRIPTGDSNFSWSLYTASALSGARYPALGARTAWHSPERNLQVGLSAQAANRSPVSYQSMGADLQLRYHRLQITTEAMRSFSEAADPWSAYIEPALILGESGWLIFGFLDYADDPLNLTAGTLSDPLRRVEYGGGVNWLPSPYTRIRAGLYFFDYLGSTAIKNGQERDFAALDLSIGVAF